VSWEIHDSWLAWMKSERIPEIMHSKLFYQYQMVRLLEIDDADGPTYAVQFYTDSMEKYEQYLAEFMQQHNTSGVKKWGIQTVEFNTLMQIVH
jgi:hypothetical protein